MMLHLFLSVIAAIAAVGGDEAARVQAVTTALGQAEPRLHRCWEQAAAGDWQAAAGRVSVRARVGPGGRVDAVELDGSLGRADLEACVRAAFTGIVVEGFEPGDSVELPLELKGEPNLTLKRDDAQALKIAGTNAIARILVDEKTSGATQASLIFVEIPAGARWMRPSTTGTAVIYVSKGRVKIGAGAAVAQGDVVVFSDGSAYPMLASMRTEMLVLLTPPGGEQAYRDGTVMGAAGTGPEPKVIKSNTAQKFPILGGKGEVDIVLEKDKAAVDRLRISPGTTVPEHSHAGEAEILYILIGKGQMTVDGSTYPVEPFMAVYIPPGAKHTFTAASSAVTNSVQAIQFYTPSGPEQRFKAK